MSLPASEQGGARLARPSSSGRRRAWLGFAPFALFSLAFMILPASSIFLGTFRNADGHFTLMNLVHLTRPDILGAYKVTIGISAVTAIAGGLFGFLLAYAVTMGGLPRTLRSGLLTYSGVASNFAGVPLAFAFIATMGRVGIVTVILKTMFGISIYDHGFNLYGFWGLSITYLYFQLPLMVLIITPALDGVKKEWREAAESLGASKAHYWFRIALPILAPPLLSSMILLFGNAFGAYATAYALTGGFIPLVPILIGAQITGDVLHDPYLGYAMAFGMVVVMTACIIAYSLLQKRASRWLK